MKQICFTSLSCLFMIETNGVVQFVNICEVVLYKFAAFDVLAGKENFCTVGTGLIAAFLLLQILFALPLCNNQQHLDLGVRVYVMHWKAFCVEWREFEGILFGVQNPKDIHPPLVGTVQEGGLNLGDFPFAGDFSPDKIIVSKYEAVMVEQQFDDCLLCRALADTNDILFLSA